MKTIFVNLPHKLLILLIFGFTYVPILYFGIYSRFDRILIGDAAKSITFIWSVFLFTLLNLFHLLLIICGNKKANLTKFIIKLNIEYGKIYVGLFFTTVIFIIQTLVVERDIIFSSWIDSKFTVINAFSIILLAFIFFPMVAAAINYFIIKYFRKAIWKQE